MRMKKITLILLLLLIIPQIAYTHSVWLEATPDKGDILTEPPKEVIFKMTGHLRTEGCNVEVFDENGNKVSKKTQFSSSEGLTTIKAKLIDGLKAGVYTVKWIFENKDKHLQPDQKGSYTFRIK
jgi:copper transport protein